MTEQSSSLWTLTGIDIETIFDKLIKLFTPFAGIFETLDWLVFQLPHRYQWLEMGVGYYTFR